jgi:hypothetical protein
MAWMQQMYSQYLNQYMMYMHSSGVINVLQPGLGVDSVQVQPAQVQVKKKTKSKTSCRIRRILHPYGNTGRIL